MLSPLAYERDCNVIVSTLGDHKTIVGGEREAGLQKAKLLWHQLYGNEPFEVDLTAPVGNEMPHVSRIQYDIVAACSHQRVFNYQVSFPHYGDETFLRDALIRYKQQFMFKQQHLNTFLVQRYDFMWHAHQVHPLAYRTDTMKILGRVINHDDSVNDRRLGSVTSAKATIKIWNHNPRPIDYSSMAKIRFTYLVHVSGVEIQGLPKPKLYLLQLSLRGSYGAGGQQSSYKIKGLVANFHGITFEFDTSRSNFIQVKSLFPS